MLSVYYASQGNDFEVTGAPSVLIAPQVSLTDLGEALEIINASSPTRLREALWLVVRAVPLLGGRDAPGEVYPSAAQRYLYGSGAADELRQLATVRREYRARANLVRGRADGVPRR